jgi:hypothetical protein
MRQKTPKLAGGGKFSTTLTVGFANAAAQATFCDVLFARFLNRGKDVRLR